VVPDGWVVTFGTVKGWAAGKMDTCELANYLSTAYIPTT